MQTRLVHRAVIVFVMLAVCVAVWVLDSGSPLSGDPSVSTALTVDASTPPLSSASEPRSPREATPEHLIAIPESPRAADGVRLMVTDASTGLPLTHGSVLVRADELGRAPARDGLPWRGPPSDFTQVIVRDDAFPPELRVREGDPLVWIGSRGYAWGSARVTGPGTTLHVALEPAGDLTLRFSEEFEEHRAPGSSDDDPLVDVELRHEGQRLVGLTEFGLTFAVDPGAVRSLGAVPSGTYELVARLKSPLGVGRVLARQVFEVPQGGDASVLVVPTDYAEPSALTLFLELDGSGEHDVRPVESVRLFRRDETGALEIVGFDAAPVWAEVAPSQIWEASYKGLSAGTYQVFLDPCALSQEVELTAGAESNLSFQLTDLATILLDVEACTADGQGVGLIWGYQENARRLRKYVVLEPGQDMAQFECVAKPVWVQVVGPELASEPVFFSPSPRARVEAAIACRPELAASARVAVIPGPHAPSPASSEFIKRVRLRGTTRPGLMHAILPWSVEEGAPGYPAGSLLGTLVFDEPGEYEMEYPVQWGRTAKAQITAGADTAAVVELHLD